MFRVPSLCPSTTSLPQAPSQQRMTLFATHNKALVDLPRLEKPLKSLSKLIFSGETLVGTHLAVGGSSEARAQLEQLASDLPPPHVASGTTPSPTSQNPPTPSSRPTACKPAPALVHLVRAHPSTRLPKQGGQLRSYPDCARPWLGASLSLLRCRPRDLPVHPAEFSLACLQAAKFARRLFRRFSSTQPALEIMHKDFPLQVVVSCSSFCSCKRNIFLNLILPANKGLKNYCACTH